MRTLTVFLLLAVAVGVCSAHWVQTNGLNDWQLPHRPAMGSNVYQETPRKLLGLPTQHRMREDFISRLDSLRASRMQSPLPDGKFIPNGIQKGFLPLRRVSSPQSQIYVIDTAIVRSTWDTTRHLYSFNANAKRISDLTQRLIGAMWVDTLRETNTYDASNHILSELYEYWSNGQWVNVIRYTYTYDANGHRLSELREDWTNGQWVNGSRYTYTYDANGSMLSDLVENWSNSQWVNVIRYTYTYDANGNMLTKLGENWSNGQWVNFTLQTYSYDAQANLTSFWNYVWLNATWTPMDIEGRSGFVVTDGAGNNYGPYWGYNFTFTRKLIVTGVASQGGNVPANCSLLQNYPNPFNPSTTIRYQLPTRSYVTLKVYDVLGREVAMLVNSIEEPGRKSVQFEADKLATGVYFYQLRAGTFVSTRKMLMLR
jgi:hypothetical protein